MKILNVIEYITINPKTEEEKKLYSVAYENEEFAEYKLDDIPENVSSFMYYAKNIIDNSSRTTNNKREYIYFN